MNAPDFLVESIPNIVHGPSLNHPQNPWLAVIFPLLLSTGGAALCYWAAGPTLGLFLGGLFIAALLTGPLITAEPTWLERGLVAAGIVHGIAAVWLVAIVRADLDLGLWASCYLTLGALVLAIGGVAVLLRSLGCGHTTSGAIVTLLALAWLTWPIWLSPALHGQRGTRIVSWLVPAHPLFATNAPLRESMGNWAEQKIAYNLTNLGDDIAYAPPSHIFKCVLGHTAVGAICVALAVLAQRRVNARASTTASPPIGEPSRRQSKSR